jgi:hypothetical protein
MFPMPCRSLIACCLLIVCASVTGCQYWFAEKETPATETWQGVFGTAGPEIVDASRSTFDTVLLEVAHIEQPISDISMVDLLWKEVDQIGALDSKTRRTLEDNGIRIGFTGPNPPRILQKMLEVDAAWREERSDGRLGTSARSITVVPGEPTHLLTGPAYAECKIDIPRASGRETMTFQNATSVLRIESETLEKGWVKLHFIPEIHYGTQATRRVATDSGWQFTNSQKIETVYSQQFSLTLNKGDVALLTATKPSPGKLGHAMFIGDGNDDQIQRMVVIRLADIRPARAKLTREAR